MNENKCRHPIITLIYFGSLGMKIFSYSANVHHAYIHFVLGSVLSGVVKMLLTYAKLLPPGGLSSNEGNKKKSKINRIKVQCLKVLNVA